MNGDPDSRLAELVHQELEKLPPVAAPRSLVPNVLAAIAARALPWWHRAWTQWPVTAQAAFLLLAVGIVMAINAGGLWLGDSVTGYSQEMSTRLAPWTEAAQSFSSLANAGRLIWEKVGQPLLIYALILAGALYLACVALGTTLFRMALRRA